MGISGAPPEPVSDADRGVYPLFSPRSKVPVVNRRSVDPTWQSYPPEVPSKEMPIIRQCSFAFSAGASAVAGMPCWQNTKRILDTARVSLRVGMSSTGYSPETSVDLSTPDMGRPASGTAIVSVDPPPIPVTVIASRTLRGVLSPGSSLTAEAALATAYTSTFGRGSVVSRVNISSDSGSPKRVMVLLGRPVPSTSVVNPL